MQGQITSAEREALQILLRGASEAHTLLPASSVYTRSLEVLRSGLVAILDADSQP